MSCATPTSSVTTSRTIFGGRRDRRFRGLGTVPGEPEQFALFGDATEPLRVPDLSPEDVRRLVPARDDQRPLYVTGYQLSVGKSGERLQVREKRDVVQEARLNDISQVNLFGPVAISGAAVQAACANEIPIAHFSMGGSTGSRRGWGSRVQTRLLARFVSGEIPRYPGFETK